MSDILKPVQADIFPLSSQNNYVSSLNLQGTELDSESVLQAEVDAKWEASNLKKVYSAEDEDFDSEWVTRHNEYMIKDSDYDILTFPTDLGNDRAGKDDYITFYFLDLVLNETKNRYASWANQAGYSTKFMNDSTKTAPELAKLGNKKYEDVADGIATAGGGFNFAKVFVTEGGNIENAKKAYASGKQATEDWVKDQIKDEAIYRQTGQVISLMMPENIQYNYGAGWNTVDGSPTGFGLLLDIVLGDTKLEKTMSHEVSKFIQSIITENGGAAAEAYSGRTYNPFVSQAFQSMGRRQFQFNWTLIPKDLTELQTIHAIAKRFRYHMHPTLSTDNAFLLYPSQVDIIYKTKNGDNTWLPKIATCVIKDFSINYTPNNQWSTVKTGSNEGAPSQYQISLTVEEIVPLIKKDIQEGY